MWKRPITTQNLASLPPTHTKIQPEPTKFRWIPYYVDTKSYEFRIFFHLHSKRIVCSEDLIINHRYFRSRKLVMSHKHFLNKSSTHRRRRTWRYCLFKPSAMRDWATTQERYSRGSKQPDWLRTPMLVIPGEFQWFVARKSRSRASQ